MTHHNDDNPGLSRALDYERLARSDHITFDDSDAGLVICVPPPRCSRYLRVLAAHVLLLGLFALVIVMEGWELYRHPERWDEWASLLVVIVMAALYALFAPSHVRSFRSWTTFLASPTRLVITVYDRSVWAENEWPRDAIADVRAVQGSRRWNLKRPASVEVRLTDRTSLAFLHSLPYKEVEPIAAALRQRLAIDDDSTPAPR